MTDEHKLIAAVDKAHKAENELRLVGEAFKKLRDSLVDAWQATDPRDDKGREKLWLATTQLTQVERTLRQWVSDGEFAAKEIERIRTAGERKSLKDRLKQKVGV